MFIRCKVWNPRESGGDFREFLIQLFVDVFKYISIFRANNSSGLRKQSFQNSWMSLENTCELEPTSLLKNELFLGYCSRILLEDFFHKTRPCTFVINRLCTAFLDNPELC